MKEYAETFYKSKVWQRARHAYIKQCGGLCERCLSQGLIEPGVIVHHKTYITPTNIYNPEITLNFNNLELLCMECHNKEHHSHAQSRRYRINELGQVIPRSRE